MLGYIENGKKTAKLVTDTGRWGSKGWYVTPTVFADVKDNDLIAQ